MIRGDVFTVFSLACSGRPIVFVVATLVALEDFSWDAEVKSFSWAHLRIDLRHKAFVRSLLDRGLVARCKIRQIHIGAPGCFDVCAERRSTFIGGDTALGSDVR
jgi:hypothetical protein